MSAILKTLKKLEEEKSIVEQKLDIEEMVRQSEAALPYSFVRSRATGTVAVLLGLSLLALAAYFVFQSVGPEPAQPGLSAQPEPTRSGAAAVKPAPVSQAALTRNPAPLGIPLAQIPETAKPVVSPAVPTPPVARQSSVAPPLAVPSAVKEVPAALKKNLQAVAPLSEIHALIESATRAAERAANQPPEIKPRRNAAYYIPGLKIKGIVFLAEGSPINHILVSTPSVSNLKMRVGENVLGATLESIESDKAVFLYQGRITETGIGE